MKRPFLLTACALPLFLAVGCGYHLGGLRCEALKDMDTFCVNMFANHTTQPDAAMQMTTALTDFLQRDGSFRMASPTQCDFVIDGTVTRISRSALRTDSRDTYVSSEIGLTVHVDFVVTDPKTGNIITRGSSYGEGSYFNTTGNIQSARAAAISFATRRAAHKIVHNLTIP